MYNAVSLKSTRRCNLDKKRKGSGETCRQPHSRRKKDAQRKEAQAASLFSVSFQFFLCLLRTAPITSRTASTCAAGKVRAGSFTCGGGWLAGLPRHLPMFHSRLWCVRVSLEMCRPRRRPSHWTTCWGTAVLFVASLQLLHVLLVLHGSLCYADLSCHATRSFQTTKTASFISRDEAEHRERC